MKMKSAPKPRPRRAPDSDRLDHQLTLLLRQLEDWLEMPMIVLAFVWLLLLIVELTRGLTPLLQMMGTIIWIAFVLEFLLRFAIAPRRFHYVRRNWLTAVSLAIPALRIVRIARALRLVRAARATRGLRLVRVVGSINRGTRALRTTMQRRGIGYVAALTLVVLVVGAAGMYTFERSVTGGLDSYGEALWWTAMLLTTMGSGFWPETAEGRVLSLLLAIYSLGILGYVTATLATFFIGQDAEETRRPPRRRLPLEESGP